jgi:plastocyanin
MKWDFSRSLPTLLLLGSIALGNAKEIEVKAGYDHVFTPDNIVADVGDTISIIPQGTHY